MADRILALDYGEKKIGVALINLKLHIATPLCVVANNIVKGNWSAIDKLIQQWQPQILVVGLPLNMDDSPTRITPKVQNFCRQLQNKYRLSVEQVDERMSSYEARQLGAEIKRGHKVDDIAAMIIAQTWLELQGTTPQ